MAGGQNRSSAVMQQRSEPHDVVTRADAKAIGQRWYFTGAPCPRGHVAKRSVSNRECRRCVDDKTAAKRRADPDLIRAKDRARHARTLDARRTQSRASRERHIEARRQYDLERYQQPERRAWQKSQATGWAKSNPGKRNAIISARRAWVKRATPAWLSDQQRAEIRAFYLAARSRGTGFHVDHIVPLRGRNVCGLNVPWNLQILTKAENIAKGNRHAE